MFSQRSYVLIFETCWDQTFRRFFRLHRISKTSNLASSLFVMLHIHLVRVEWTEHMHYRISSWCSSWCTGLSIPRPILWKCLMSMACIDAICTTISTEVFEMIPSFPSGSSRTVLLGWWPNWQNFCFLKTHLQPKFSCCNKNSFSCFCHRIFWLFKQGCIICIVQIWKLTSGYLELHRDIRVKPLLFLSTADLMTKSMARPNNR